jgi:hypothetical protein
MRTLKDYKQHPTAKRKRELARRFDAVFIQKTLYATLDRLLRRIHMNKSELLLVLERPEVPLHTNGSHAASGITAVSATFAIRSKNERSVAARAASSADNAAIRSRV